MKIFKQQMVLSAIAIAGMLSIGGVTSAIAAVGPVARVQVAEPASPGLTEQAHYRFHGRTYAYRYHGKFFNHRSRKGGNWSYY